jgi:predicted transposase/invertase (TIGR01784 family)
MARIFINPKTDFAFKKIFGSEQSKDILISFLNMVDKWLYFLNCASQLETVPSSLKAVPAIEHAFNVPQQSGLNPKELEVLEKREMALHDSRNAILKAQQDALQRGLQQGLEQGLQQGLKEGLVEGEKRKAIDIARSLLDVLDVETIAQKTGLSLEEVRQLAEGKASG